MGQAKAFGPVPTLSQAVADWVAEQVVRGRWPYGARITEQEVADALSISRQPVREALLALREQGIIDYQPRQGAVNRFTLDMVRDVYETRSVLETWICTVSVPLLDDGDIQSFSTALQALDASEDSDRFYDDAWRIRMIVYSRCTNRVTFDLVTKMRSQIRGLPHVLYGDVTYRQLTLSTYRGVLDAARKRDGEAAAGHIRTYLSESCERTCDYLREMSSGAIADSPPTGSTQAALR